MKFIQQREYLSSKPVIFGRLARKWKRNIDVKSKYFIPDTVYNKTEYPDFVTGPFYFMSSPAAVEIVDKIKSDYIFTTEKNSKKKSAIILEDVFVTGIVANELKIDRINTPYIFNRPLANEKEMLLFKNKGGISIHRLDSVETFLKVFFYP